MSMMLRFVANHVYEWFRFHYISVITFQNNKRQANAFQFNMLCCLLWYRRRYADEGCALQSYVGDDAFIPLLRVQHFAHSATKDYAKVRLF